MPIATKLRRQRLQRASKTVDVGGSAGLAASAMGAGDDLAVEQVSWLVCYIFPKKISDIWKFLNKINFTALH